MSQTDEQERCSPFDLTIEAENGTYVVCLDDRSLRTPEGNILQHQRRALVDTVIEDLCRQGDLVLSNGRIVCGDVLTILEFLCAEIDSTISSMIKFDPGTDPLLLIASKSSGRQDARIAAVVEALRCEASAKGRIESVATALWNGLVMSERNAAGLLARRHLTGHGLAACLAARRIDERTYGRAAMCFREAGVVRSLEECAASFTAICKEAWLAKLYLEASFDDVERLVEGGEDAGLEFKSTFRFNTKTRKFDERVVHASLKTIAAFMNGSGGKLVIGVTDNKEPYPNLFAADELGDADKFQRHVVSRVKSCLGDQAAAAIDLTVAEFREYPICIVHCPQATDPVVLSMKKGEQEFFVRMSASTYRMEYREAFEYVRKRFWE